MRRRMACGPAPRGPHWSCVVPELEQITLTAGDKSVAMPVLHPTLGQPCIDIAKLPKETGCFTYDPGFGATASCKSAITYIDGDAGVLLYRGYPIEQLAEKSTFTEVAYLLMHGELPDCSRASRRPNVSPRARMRGSAPISPQRGNGPMATCPPRPRPGAASRSTIRPTLPQCSWRNSATSSWGRAR